jgi:hypothetical protein
VPDRVLLVLATSTGGVGRHVASLAAGLTAAGLAVTVAAPASTARTAALPGHVEVDVGERPSPVRDLRALRLLRRLPSTPTSCTPTACAPEPWRC